MTKATGFVCVPAPPGVFLPVLGPFGRVWSCHVHVRHGELHNDKSIGFHEDVGFLVPAGHFDRGGRS